MPAKNSMGSINFNKQGGQAITQSGASSAIDLLSQTILPKVAELARSGKYREAESLLEQLVQEGATIPALFDLLAKIRAQQGRLMEAQACWVEAIHYDSTNEYYRGALKCIEHFQSRPVWIWRIGIWLFRLGLICGVVMIILGARLYFQEIKDAHPRPLQAVKQNIKRTAPQNLTQKLKNMLPQRTERPAIPSSAPPKVAVHITGVLVDTRDNQVIIRFTSGLFLHGAELLPEAQATLDLLAEQLRPYLGKILVNVEGHTDNLPIFTNFQDNESLGMHRAVAVVEYLRLKGKFPAEMFTASGLGELRSLYPNDTPNNQLRNRTVVIRITALEY